MSKLCSEYSGRGDILPIHMHQDLCFITIVAGEIYYLYMHPITKLPESGDLCGNITAFGLNMYLLLYLSFKITV